MASEQRSFQILLVEDDKADIAFFKAELKRKLIDCDLVVAEHGMQAIDLLKNNYQSKVQQPDVMLLDINMPYLNGMNFLFQRKRHQYLSDIHTIMLTASEDPKKEEEAYAMGALDFLHKPFDADALLEILVKNNLAHTKTDSGRKHLLAK